MFAKSSHVFTCTNARSSQTLDNRFSGFSGFSTVEPPQTAGVTDNPRPPPLSGEPPIGLGAGGRLVGPRPTNPKVRQSPPWDGMKPPPDCHTSQSYKFVRTGRPRGPTSCLVRSATMLLFGVASYGQSSVLELKGEGAHIKMGDASLSMTCAGDAKPTILSVEESSKTPGAVVAHLSGVATSCANAGLSQPCVELSTLVPRPPGFRCAFKGVGELPMVHAKLLEERSSMGELLGVSPVVECPAVPWASLQSISSSSGSAALSLSLTFTLGPRAIEIPAAEGVTMSLSIAVPEAPTPPPSPPPL